MFKLQIGYLDGQVAQLPTGKKLEVHFANALTAELAKSHHIGWFTSQAKVLQAVEAALATVVLELKKDAKFALSEKG